MSTCPEYKSLLTPQVLRAEIGRLPRHDVILPCGKNITRRIDATEIDRLTQKRNTRAVFYRE